MENNKWVSVEERLPDVGSTVLTFPHFKVLPFGNIELDKTGKPEIDNGFWEWCGDDEIGTEKPARPHPTHWMPLPSPPKQTP